MATSGRKSLDLADGVGPVRRGGDHLDVRVRFQQVREGLAHEAGVVGDEHALHWLSLSVPSTRLSSWTISSGLNGLRM